MTSAQAWSGLGRALGGVFFLLGWVRGAKAVHYDLVWAPPTGRWRPFATLTTAPAHGRPDAELTFDPVLHQIPGLEAYAWAAELRRYAYAGSRRARRARP